ncbi:MAG: peptide deformylase [Dehalococcoidia bacterium]|nr:peptide deformylase [Dehalococcoidia bacterium]
MAVLNIRTLPDPLLRQKARRVNKIDDSLQRLIDDMIDTMRDADGAGLAANQVGVLRRVIVIEIPEEEQVLVLINPDITRREGEREVEEGCLSIPGYRGELKRSLKVRARGTDRDGRPVRIRAEGLLAQALEHEMDHINGILYIDHLESAERLWKLEPQEAGTQTEAS